MPLLLRNIALALDEPEEALPARAARRLKLPVDAIAFWGIVRRAIDARAGEVRLVYNIELSLDSPQTENRIAKRLHRTDVTRIAPEPPPSSAVGSEPMAERPVVIGFGPAGMFGALILAEHGYRPVVLERGREVRQRHVDVLKRFWRDRDFDPESNMLFGEGGAGCYSDGKLRTRINDPRVDFVLQTFYRHGADADILINSRPHIGSDHLPPICRRIRERIEQLGGEVRFATRVESLRPEEGQVVSLGEAGGSTIPLGGAGVSSPAPVLLGIGHSARDTFRSLASAGIALAVKPLQVGVRIEHPQEMIDAWRYGPAAGHPRLGAAEYQVVAKGAGGPRGDVFSFCMCPGGQVVPCNEAVGRVSVNGASRARRNGDMGNSGLVVTLGPESVGEDPLAVLDMLADWERKAFEAAGADYRAPVQRAADFVEARGSDGDPMTSYPLGGSWCELRDVLPADISEALATGLTILGRRFEGFDGADALLVAPETRASCPIRIVRDPGTRASVSAGNLYPIGEGAGYAGGIVSSGVDGIRTAEAVMARYAPPR
ncbi:MAG: FAD-dependent oxidoreductase [Phycisphaerae bacterium]|nr:FAD-dependent oxidoreductase [Phycisphaerae bacterium]